MSIDFMSSPRLLAHADEPLPAIEQESDKHAIFNPYQDEDKGKGTISEEERKDAPQEEKQPEASCLKCNECGKRFRNVDWAQLHATKTGHVDFGESTENTTMTAEERAAHLETLKARLKGKKEQEAVEAAEHAKKNELLRRKAGRDLGEFKEKLEGQQVAKALEEQKRAKLEEKTRRAKILAQIDEDRRLKRERVT
jgi:UBX domain-containing protein 1/4